MTTLFSMLAPLFIFVLVLSGSLQVHAEDAPHPAIARGYAALRDNRLLLAEREFRTAMDENPSKEARFGLGAVLIKDLRYREALSIMETLVKEFPDDYFIKNNIAWVYATAADPGVRNGKKAIEFAQDALLSQPGSYHVWSTLCEGYYVSGAYEKAYRAAEQALRLASENKAAARDVQTYREQIQKCARARESMSLME